MPTSTGGSEVRAYMAALPGQIEKLLRGAGRAGGKVLRDEVEARANSQEVKDGLIVTTKQADGMVKVTVTVKPGWAYSLALWGEWGTDPHFISIDDSQRRGMSIRKANEAHKAGSLAINGQFVGSTVFHPGARAHPIFRPALDIKGADAIAAAQAYINSRVKRSGIVLTNDEADDG